MGFVPAIFAVLSAQRRERGYFCLNFVTLESQDVIKYEVLTICKDNTNNMGHNGKNCAFHRKIWCN